MDFSVTQARELIGKYIKPMLEQNADHIVLGCTHYPFLEKVIREFAGEGVTIVNPAPAIARRAEEVLKARRGAESVSEAGENKSNRFVTTGGNILLLKKMAEEIAPGQADSFVFEKIELLPLSHK